MLDLIEKSYEVVEALIRLGSRLFTLVTIYKALIKYIKSDK